jgi:hypothetical protein
VSSIRATESRYCGSCRSARLISGSAQWRSTTPASVGADERDLYVPLSELSPHEPLKKIEDGETAVFFDDLGAVIQAADGDPDPRKVYAQDGSRKRFVGPLTELPHPEREEEQSRGVSEGPPPG